MVLVFDLDDTLYPECAFVQSGLRAVAAEIAPNVPEVAYSDLWRLFETQGSGRLFDQYAEKHGVTLNIPRLVSLYRNHRPNLTLPQESRAVLNKAKQRYKLAIVTDGPAQTQRNKYEALGLDAWIDYPFFTDAGQTSKPARSAFEPVVARFGSAERYVYVGDNPAKDFDAPRAMGWLTIRLRRANGIYRDRPNTAHHEIMCLKDALPLVDAFARAGRYR